ncbi:adenylosuccinate lyase [Desulfurobacterium thermolithotrophum DSM 11699]|uniref:Adenylosuccinate lyase n=1 Tax=Desulfurobacterium thermolithotrophum (strain DSM 11699 / BSA) TaxID=868864 RepID=F0S3Y4_DESTD|nr:adenylosuccinate lyase [Desulfurobacterium thermolithotrophum]ADY73556.1 adenylosuccinate lyase [Desulfurobacterium thermolithotrophum DSM 11699]
MIPRYTLPEMGAIWDEQNKLRNWLKVEVAAAESWAELGKLPKDAIEKIKEKVKPFLEGEKDFDIKRINEIEEVTNHDVIAFLTYIKEVVGDEAKYLHFGMTSSDMLDTAFALQIKQAGELLLKDIEKVMEAIKKRAFEHKMTVMIGRTHGIHAEPITFGLKLAIWYDEMKRNYERLQAAVKRAAVGKISGAVGTFANIDPRVEEMTCERLGIGYAKASNQVVQRDRHAEFLAAMALTASSIEKFATEIRHLQRTEVREVEEPFRKGQKGSSAMPHKRNPILSERLCGLARVVRSASIVGMENIPLWHERDISHSSTERTIFPDACIALDYMLQKFANLMENLVVYPENMMKNLNLLRGLVFSQRVLLTLIEKGGLSREDSYAIVQENAMKVWNEGADFKELLKADERVRKVLTEEEIDEIFDLSYHTKNVDYIFKRVFGE